MVDNAHLANLIILPDGLRPASGFCRQYVHVTDINSIKSPKDVVNQSVIGGCDVRSLVVSRFFTS